MCKINRHNQGRRIDPCMRIFVKLLDYYLEKAGLRIKACCCGHKKYNMSIVVEGYPEGTMNIQKIFKKPIYQELFSGMIINRTKKFYKKDKQGYYYIPEAIKKERLA